MKRRGLIWVWLLLADACAGNPYQRAGDPGLVAGALARARPAMSGAGKPINAIGRPLAFLALSGAGGPRVAAYDLLSSHVVWTQPAAITGRIQVGPEVIVHGIRGGVVARDIDKGKVRWTHALGDGERLLGYAIDGDSAFVAVERGGHGVVLALEARTGLQRWQHTLPSANAGGPAAGRGLVAVAVQSQYVILLDGATGDELAQVISNEEAASFVRALPEGLFFGSQGVFALLPETARASRRSPGYVQAKLPSFVRPFYGVDLYRPEQADYSAIDKKRILWRMEPAGDRARFRNDLAIVHDYRFFFAFDAPSGRLRWAYSHPRTEAVSSELTGKALLFVTADGELGALEASTGRRFFEARLAEEEVRGATFDAEGFAPGAEITPIPTPSLAAMLTAIVWDLDRRFADRKLFATTELARQPGRTVTAELVKILQDEGFDADVHRKAGEGLVGRQDAAPELVAEALEAHEDYADRMGRRTAVEDLAHVAGAMGARAGAAVPPLMRQLLRPETEPDAATEIARALRAIGAPRAVPALRDFLTLYRADPTYDAAPAALVAAADALLALGGPSERQLLLYLALDPRTVDPLREHLESALP